MSVATLLHGALKGAGIPIVGVSVSRLDARGELAAWQKAQDAVAEGKTFGLVDEDDVARIIDGRNAAEIAQKIARYTGMVENPDTRPWDKRKWRVDFTDAATPQQRAQAATIIESFNPDTPPAPPTLVEKLARIGITLAELKDALK